LKRPSQKPHPLPVSKPLLPAPFSFLDLTDRNSPPYHFLFSTSAPFSGPFPLFLLDPQLFISRCHDSPRLHFLKPPTLPPLFPPFAFITFCFLVTTFKRRLPAMGLNSPLPFLILFPLPTSSDHPFYRKNSEITLPSLFWPIAMTLPLVATPPFGYTTKDFLYLYF